MITKCRGDAAKHTAHSEQAKTLGQETHTHKTHTKRMQCEQTSVNVGR